VSLRRCKTLNRDESKVFHYGLQCSQQAMSVRDRTAITQSVSDSDLTPKLVIT
jgi:hypothetical protein